MSGAEVNAISYILAQACYEDLYPRSSHIPDSYAARGNMHD